MSDTVIKVENLSKQYRLGSIGTGTLRHDLQRWWCNVTGKEDPNLKIGMENNLKTSNGSKGLDDYVWALKDINFEVKQGEVLGIIGKNGAGKSTLLKILSQVTTPTTGNVKVKGRIASLLEVGTGFHPELTGRENIFLNGAILGMTKMEIRSKFDEIIDFAGIEKYIDTPVKRYSSGMYVRLAFAVAAHLEPEILIVDEVLAVGDAEFQKKALGKMQDISKGQGRTVLFVSHNLATIKYLCHNAIILNNGEVQYNGEACKAIENYLDTLNSKNSLEYRHKEGNLDLSITKIGFPKNKNIFGVFEKIEINIEYKVHKFIQEVEFFIIFTNTFQEDILSLFQRDSRSFHVVDEKKGLIKVTFENTLMPGKYYVSAGIFNVKKEFVDWVENVESIEVEPFYGNGTKYDLRLGKVSLHAIWE